MSLRCHCAVPGTIPAPSIEYSQLAPMLVVFGAAVIGVLVEAFAPRALRRAVHLLLTLRRAWSRRSSGPA